MEPYKTIYQCQKFNLDDPYNLSLLALKGMIPLDSIVTVAASK